ncbi:hypothetical protein M514_26860 [Trichuris suis]|uniref:Integrase catalytic domain-containing protein n=1 Tax=Trichuris suis TaxID=68888 RepID=A0A085MUR6_9BILA|nr:hypothetical protein M514_26860 [Trichuris suis]
MRHGNKGQVLHITAQPPTNSPYLEGLDADESAGFTKVEGNFLAILKRVQSECSPKELADLKAGRPLKGTSVLLSFTPFLDKDGLIRVGGRLGRAALPYDNRHPILLPARHPLSRKIAEEFHCRLNYSGTDTVLSAIRQHFWIVQGRQLVKNIRRSCGQCIKESTRTIQQLMSELPVERLAVGCPPFHHTSVDYFGPVQVTIGRNRPAKRYGVIFTCLTIRAVYLDVARSLSTEDFLLVLRRFISLYGKPESMYSDNGRNFVGAERDLRHDLQVLSNDPAVEKFSTREGIRWKFQPANAAHFGGVHESLVKSTKRALYRMLASSNTDLHLLTEDVLRTLLFEVAGLLNSRPITYASSDPQDFRPLTPNDLMNRPSIAHVPEGNFNRPSMRQRYKQVERLSTLFSELWKKYYLPTLIQRTKWKIQKRNLSVGDYVLLAESNVPKGEWVTGRVEDVFPGPDGLVRVAKVATKAGTYIRPIHRLCSLHESSPPNLARACSGGQECSGENDTCPPTRKMNLPAR